MPIADHHKIQTVYNTGHHWPCGGQFFTPHMVHGCPASLSHRANDRLSNVLSVFQFLTFVAYPLGQRSPKGEMTWYPPRSTILQNFSPIAQTVYEMCVTKVFSLFGLGWANPWAKVHQKGRWPGGLLDLPSGKISSPYVNPCPRYPLTKSFAQTNSNRYIPGIIRCWVADNKGISWIILADILHISTCWWVEHFCQYTGAKYMIVCHSFSISFCLFC